MTARSRGFSGAVPSRLRLGSGQISGCIELVDACDMSVCELRSRIHDAFTGHNQ